MNLFFAIMLYPLLPILHWQMQNEAKPKKNIVLGVTLPYSLLQDEALLLHTRNYARSMRRALLISHALLLPLLLLWKEASAFFGALLLWVTAVIVLYHVLYIRAHNALRRFKLEQGLSMETAAARIRVDTCALAGPEPAHGLWAYAGALLLCLAPFLWARIAPPAPVDPLALLLGCGGFFLVVALFAFADRALLRRSEAVSEESALNLALTRARRVYWRRCCLYSSYLTGLFSLLLYLMFTGLVGEPLGMACMLLYVFAELFVVCRAEFLCRRMQERLAGALEAPVDSDAHWPYGMFYHNPADRRLLVHSRVGMGSTLNIAWPAGKLFLGFAALCALALPLTALWLMGADESAPAAISVEGDTLCIRHGWSEKELPLGEIRDIERLESISGSVRVFGTGLPGLLKGRFSMTAYPGERCWFCLDPRDAPFVSFVCGDVRYVLNESAAGALLAGMG